MAKPTARLVYKLPEVLEHIQDGWTIRRIARHYGTSLDTLQAWIESDPGHSRACARAREDSAFDFAQKAEDVLRDESVDPVRARELAAHYRWEAKMRSRGVFGEKLDVESKVTVQNLTEQQIDERITRLTSALAEAGASRAAGNEATIH